MPGGGVRGGCGLRGRGSSCDFAKARVPMGGCAICLPVGICMPVGLT